MDAAIIRQGELVGRELMAYETAEEVGSVEHLLVDVTRSHVMGLTYKTAGLLSRKQSLSWSQLVKIGRDSIVIHTEASPALVVESERQLAAAQNMIGLEVWTDGGDHIGRIVDLSVEVSTGEVQQYLFALNPAPALPNQPVPNQPMPNQPADAAASAGGVIPSEGFAIATVSEPIEPPDQETVTVYALPPQAIISAGRKRMMIAEEDAQRSQHASQSLTIQPTPSSAAKWRPEQLPEIPTDLGSLLHKGQSFAGKLTEQVKQRAKQFTDEQLAHQDFIEADSLPDITEQLQSKTEQVKQQMQAQLKRAKEKAQAQIDHSGLEDRLGNTPLGRSLGNTFDRFKRSKKADQIDPIDVESFEVWEDD